MYCYRGSGNNLTFVPVFQSKIGLDPDTGFLEERWGGGAVSCNAFTQITTSDWSISDDCANVVYN